MSENKNFYILDTNVLIHDPKSLFGFPGARVGIPAVVLEELDQFKSEGTERGRNTRETIRQLDHLRSKGSLQNGVPLDNGGTVEVIFFQTDTLTQTPLVASMADNKILLTALSLKNDGHNIIFISKDLNARVKADALGIPTEDYSKDYISEKEFYQGWTKISLPSIELKNDSPKELLSLVENNTIKQNEFIIAESHNNPHNYRVYRYYGKEIFKPVYLPNLSWPLQARNPEQLMSLNLLMDPTIQFVCLFGPAGTGKTFLALLAGLHQVFVNKQYERMLISRPVVPLGRDIGFLPGTVEEKMQSWMLPIYDNMNFIMHSINKSQKNHAPDHTENSHKRHKNKKEHLQKKPRHITFEDLLHQGKISLEPITYMRGRTIPYQFILIDEAQNLNPHEIKTLITRVGEGSKIILTGDPYQIDSTVLDFSSNGLVVASERFKGQSLFGSVFLPTSERSELSKLAGELM